LDLLYFYKLRSVWIFFLIHYQYWILTKGQNIQFAL
jgi:hypothetical protein